MLVKNKRNNQILTRNLLVIKNELDKFLGLLKYKNRHLLLNTRFGIHTFGLKKPIDVIICDINYCVKITKYNLIPNRIFIWNPAYNIVLELPSGTILKSKTKIGDFLSIG